MLSDLQLVYMVPKNSTQLLNINTTKFQVEREPVYTISNHCKLYRLSTFFTEFLAALLLFKLGFGLGF